MNLGERIKKLRKDLGLTQKEFGERIGTTQNNLTRYETNKVNPSAAVLTFICREFNVREEWLREGEGEVFEDTDKSILAQMAEKYHLNDGQKELIATFLSLSDAQREAIVFAVCKAAQNITGHLDTPPAALPKVSESAPNAAEKQREPPAEVVAVCKDSDKPEGVSEKEWAVILQMREHEELEKISQTSTALRSIA